MIEIRGRNIKIILYLLEQNYAVSAPKVCKEIDVNIDNLKKGIPKLKNFLRKNVLTLITKEKICFKIEEIRKKEEVENKPNRLQVLNTT